MCRLRRGPTGALFNRLRWTVPSRVRRLVDWFRTTPSKKSCRTSVRWGMLGFNYCQNRYKIVLKPSQSCPKLVPKSSPNHSQFVTSSFQNRFKLVPNSFPNRSRVVPKSFHHHPNIIPKSSQTRSRIIPTLSHNRSNTIPQASHNYRSKHSKPRKRFELSGHKMTHMSG